MSKVAINLDVLRWAVGRAGLTPEDLEPKFPKIQQWVSGENQPTLHQLEDIAKATRTPFGFLFLSKPPEERLPIPHFRTITGEVSSRPSPDLLETIQTMQLRQAWMRDYLIEQGQEPLSMVRSAKANEPPSDVADRIRDSLGLKSDWATQEPNWTSALRTLRVTIGEAGILLVTNGVVGNNTHRKLNPDEFRGFVLVDEYAPLVFVNGADGKAAQMFTLAHELATCILGQQRCIRLARNAASQRSDRASM